MEVLLLFSFVFVSFLFCLFTCLFVRFSVQRVIINLRTGRIG